MDRAEATVGRFEAIANTASLRGIVTSATWPNRGQRRIVRTLEDQSLRSAFRHVIQLLRAFFPTPGGGSCDSAEEAPEDTAKVVHKYGLNRENVVAFIQAYLYLPGVLGVHLKRRMLSLYRTQSGDAVTVCQAWVVLECLVEEQLSQSLDVSGVFSCSPPDVGLVQVLACRLPKVAELKFSFRQSHTTTLRAFATSLNRLTNLTQLCLLMCDDGDSCILGYLGQSCPRLTHLTVVGFRVSCVDVLSLLLGADTVNLIRKMPKEERERNFDQCLHSLQVSPQFLSPCCSTLQHLELGSSHGPLGNGLTLPIPPPDPPNASTLAFLLRHGLKLETVRILGCSPLTLGCALRMLKGRASSRTTRQRPSMDQRLKIELEGVAPDPDVQPSRIVLSWFPKAPFTDFLKLTKLDGVNLRCVETVRAVGELCRNLNEVVFCQIQDGIPATKAVKRLLSCDWPKVHVVTFRKVARTYVRLVLDAIGAHVMRLTFLSCENIHLVDLEPCAGLESLQILSSSALNHGAGTSHQPPSKKRRRTSDDVKCFLPKLGRLESDVCLGPWSKHLEEKSTLRHLVLNCSHIGTAGSSWKWNADLAHLWPNIRILRLKQTDGLTGDIVVEVLLPRMEGVKVIGLSRRLFDPLTERRGRKLLEDLVLTKWPEIDVRIETAATDTCFFSERARNDESDGERSDDEICPVDSYYDEDLDQSVFYTQFLDLKFFNV